jgi:hypothetical protein
MPNIFCREVYSLDLLPLDYWGRGFEFRCEHEYLCLCLLCIV